MKYLAIAFLIILVSVNLVVFDYGFYKNQGSCDERCGEVIKYFFFSDLELSEKELMHMEDVRILVWSSIFISFVLFGFALFSKKSDFLYGGIITLGLVLLLLLFILLDFSKSFEIFHKILFRNDFWLLPPDSALIQMFPSDFFYKACVRIILYSITFSGLSILRGILRWQK